MVGDDFLAYIYVELFTYEFAYDKYADEYYDEEISEESENPADPPAEEKQESYSVSVEKSDDITDVSEEMKIFADTIFADGFFDSDDEGEDEYTENLQ